MSNTLINSGIDWIGKIPDYWKSTKLKYLSSITTGKRDVNHGSEDGIYPFFTCSMFPKRINEYSFDCEALLIAGNGFVGYTQYYKGKFDAYQRTYVISSFDGIYPIFLKYYVSNLLIKSVESKSIGSVIDFIKLGDIRDFIVFLPKNKTDQQAIANFLDDKTAKIDELIKLQETSIEKLEEYKQSIITEAVSKGLNPNVEYMESKLEFCESVPNNFYETRFKYIAKVSSGLSIPKAEYVNDGIEYLHYGDIHANNESCLNLKHQQMPKIPFKYKEKKVSAYLNEGDLVFCDTSEDLEGAGKHIYVKSLNDKEVISGSHTIIARKCMDFESAYMSYLFSGSEVKSEIESRVYGIKVYSMSQSILKDINVVLPPIRTQKEISQNLDIRCNEINNIITIKKDKIDKLNEYKKSLIYEAVTGKIEVM